MNDDTSKADGPRDEEEPFSMDEVQDTQAPPSSERVEAPPETEPLSITDKMIGVYTEPEPTFQNLKLAGPHIRDWLVPLALMIIVLSIATAVRFSDPAFMRDITKQQEERFEKMVEQGDMTEEQADQALDQMESMGTGLMMGITLAGMLFGTPIIFLLIALFYWLVLRFVFKGSATYYLTFCALALTAYISLLDPLVSLILGYATGNPFATLSPALFMEHDATDTTYLLLSSLKPITIWSMAVLSIGFTKIAEISRGKAYGLVFGAWAVFTVVSAFMGWGMGQM